MREVGAYEAKNSLGALLDCVAHGEEITITRRGKAVAKLVAPNAGFDRAAARAACVPRRSGQAVEFRLGPLRTADGPEARDQLRVARDGEV